MKLHALPPAVVLDLDFSGYGAVRSLSGHGIPIIGFVNVNKYIPEQATSLCAQKIKYTDEQDLLQKLKALGESHASQKPSLILTSDYYVLLIKKHYEELSALFHINYPSGEVVDLLMSKDAFTDFAIEHQVKIPKTLVIQSYEDFVKSEHEFDYPLIMKPSYRTKEWGKAGLPKAFFCDNAAEIEEAYRKSSAVEKEMLVQEYIPGEDWDIYFCLAYFDENSQCVAAFTGKKVRQWPVDTGSTASTIAVEDEALRQESIRMLSLAGLKGFGSVEYKRHSVNGGYYVMEPTVGRLNQQEYVATLNGVNVPLAGYSHMQQLELDFLTQPKRPIIYVDELAELASTLTHFKRKNLSLKEWWRSYRGFAIRFRYFYRKDMKVFFGLIRKILIQIKNKLFS